MLRGLYSYSLVILPKDLSLVNDTSLLVFIDICPIFYNSSFQIDLENWLCVLWLEKLRHIHN